MLVPRVLVKVSDVDASENNGATFAPFVTLQDDARREIRVFIGQCEAEALSRGLQGKAPERPLTYEAMLTCMTMAGATVEDVYVYGPRDETFYALVSLRVGEHIHGIDMRPSDALNLAVRTSCPLFVSESVFQASQQPDKPSLAAESEVAWPLPAVSRTSSEISEELARLFSEDQSDRMPAPHQEINWDMVAPRDAARLARVKELYQSQALRTGQDFFFAAMILQHAHDPDDYLLAHEFCVIAASQGVEGAKWLAAASEDRFLMNIGRPQRFGTQYRKDGADGKWSLYDVSTELTDGVRGAFDVPPLFKAKAGAERMNK